MFQESTEDFCQNNQDREISSKKKMWRSLFFDKFEDLQPAVLLKLNLFKGAFQGFRPQLQLATLKNSYFKLPFFQTISQWILRKFWN